MGNFHCIPNQCARVVFQRYEKSGGIRYRYPDEDWIYVDGDDWSIEEKTGQAISNYYVYANFNFLIGGGNSRYGYACGDTASMVSQSPIQGKVISYEIPEFSNFQSIYIKIQLEQLSGQIVEKFIGFYTLSSSGVNTGNSPSYYTSCSFSNMTDNIFNIRFESIEGSDIGKECIFKILKNDEIVHEETRNDCPEVELVQDGCQLSDQYEEILVDKLGYLQRVEVRNQLIETGYYGALPAPFTRVSPLPENTLIIYKTLITAPPLLSEYVPLPGFINPYIQVAEISSDPDCPPPEYTVYCDCDCRSCPPGSCAIECGDHVCCNDPTTGKLIDSIPSDKYCEN